MCASLGDIAGPESRAMNKMDPPPVAPAAAHGIMCLTAVARFHGLDVSEGQLAHLAAGEAVIGPAELVRLSQKIGLSAKLVRLSWPRLDRLGQALPAILILRDGGAAILSGIRQT